MPLLIYEILCRSRLAYSGTTKVSKGISKYDTKNSLLLSIGMGKSSTYILEKKLQIMTYDKINILLKKNIEGLETLNKVKVIIFDECHTLFSDANFIKDMEMLKVWIRDNLYIGNKIFIGLTATPNIIEYYQKEWGVSINKLNDEVLVNYKVKQLHCTDFDTIPYIVTTQIEGKTMIMCYSYNHVKLKERIPNSFFLQQK